MDETVYTFDLQKLFQFIFQENDLKNLNESELVDVFEADENNSLTLIQRQIREAKTNNNDNKTAIRYDIFKMFIDIMSEITDTNLEVMTPLQAIVFNTLINQEIITNKQ